MHLKFATLIIAGWSLVGVWAADGGGIDREALVTRHNVELKTFDARNPLSVGNGEFCFTVDATGLQTFPEAFVQTTPLATLADWAWHTAPNPEGYDIDKFQFKLYTNLPGRAVPYADVPHNQQTPEIKWLRANPHKLDLAQIGFVLREADGSLAGTNELSDFSQKLDLWSGEIQSHFQFAGQPVDVVTVADPDHDGLAVRVESPLLQYHRLAIRIQFPYGTGETITADWNHPEAHQTAFVPCKENSGFFERTLDNDHYVMGAAWGDGVLHQTAKHEFVIESGTGKALEFTGFFAPQLKPDVKFANFKNVRSAAAKHWKKFWMTGGAIDLSGSTDPRWFELERRIVLSQYLTAIQSAGDYPPAETGLTYNTWEGKFHLEMHWWHEAHFALWDRLPLFERSLGYYQKILPRAEGTAKKQGYAGARWPKMTSPSGAESPSPVGPFLVWEEPHPIFYAELVRRAHPDKATLKKYSDIVFATADFMASFPAWDEKSQRCVLGPTLQCAQEIFPKDKTFNPTFELTYWRWGLEMAQQWRLAMGLPREPKWDEVLAKLAKPVVSDGKYLFTESTPDSYTNPKWDADHPAVLGALSFVPGPGIDPATMRNTLDWIRTNWNWPDTWGWDYPLMAMTAARLGEGERAVDALLLDTPKNHYGINGQVYQRPGLTTYLPANGGLLYATALMAAGWDGAPKVNSPGFPQDGKWKVKWEGLRVAP